MQRRLPKECRCGCKRFKKLNSDVRTMPYAGTLPDGYEFNAIQWERKKCSECGQILAIKTYLP